MDRILLTGATGVVGRRVLPLLVSAGHRVTAVGRTPEQQELLRAVGANPVSMNLLDPASVRAAVEGNDVVVNLATHMPTSMLRMLLPPVLAGERPHPPRGVRHPGQRRDRRPASVASSRNRSRRSTRTAGRLDRRALAPPSGALQPHRARCRGLGGAFRASGATGVVLRFAWFYGPDPMLRQDPGRSAEGLGAGSRSPRRLLARRLPRGRRDRGGGCAGRARGHLRGLRRRAPDASRSSGGSAQGRSASPLRSPFPAGSAPSGCSS